MSPKIMLGVGQVGLFSNISDRTDKKYLDSLIAVADTTVSDTVRAINYLKVAVALNIDGQTQFDGKTGKEYFELARAIVTTNNKLDNFVEALDNIGVRKRRNGHLKQALKFHIQALSLLDLINRPRLKAIILNNIGVVYRRVDDYSDALAYHIRALKIADSLNDDRTKAMALNSIGNVYMALEKYNDALQSFKKSLSLEYDRSNKLGIAINLNNIGSVYQAMGNLNKAYEYFKLSLDVNREINSLKGVGICHNDIGNVYYDKKQFRKALEQYAISEQIFIETGDKLYLANTYLKIGQALVQTGEVEKAKQTLLKALEIAVPIGSKVVTEKTYQWLSKAYENSHDFEKAFHYVELANSLQDSINSIVIQKNIIRMQIKYDIEAKEKEIVLLQQQQKINGLELKKQKTANLLMLVGIVLILTTMVFLIYYVHIRNQKNRLLEEKNREIEQAGNELKKYSEDLLVAKQLAEKSSKAKSEFLANMSHEFRTPLNSIIGFTELILSSESDTDKKEKLKLIHSSSKSLLVLLTDILDLSRVESGKLQIDYEPVDVSRVVEELCSMFKINAHKKGLIFECSVQNQFPNSVLLSELRLRQVLLNLVGNAVKFTRAGEIHLEVTFEPVTKAGVIDFCIKVKDTGNGISKEDIDRIFEPFVQLDSSSATQGTGLGLSITRQIVELMGGELLLESEPGVGSCFAINFRQISILGDVIIRNNTTHKEVVEDVSDINAVLFTNEEDECIDLYEFLQNTIKNVTHITSNLSRVKQIISEVDFVVLCSNDNNVLSNAYRVLSQSSNSEHLWFFIVSEDDELFKKVQNTKHLVMIHHSEGQQKQIKKLIFEINADKLFGKLSDCVNKSKNDSEFKTTMIREVFPLFFKAAETKLMNNLSAFAMALDKVAEKFEIEAVAIYSSHLKKSINNFDVKAIEKLLDYFKTNCIESL